MTSVHLAPHRLAERHPLADQPHQLRHLAGVLLGNSFEHGDLLLKQRKVIDRPAQFLRHLDIARQRVSRQDDALIGLSWGHGEKP